MSENSHPNISLDAYTKFCPPGWEPHLAWYPLKNYRENLDLWGHLITDPDTGRVPPMSYVGPLIIGRLRGSAKRLALKMTLTYPTEAYPEVAAELRGTTITGTAVIVFGGIPENQSTGFPGMPSGLVHMLYEFEAAYGRDAQDVSGEAMDRFDACVRGNASLMDYITAHKIRYETAEEKAGYHINEIARTHRFLKGANLHKRFIDDVMLKVDGDRERFQEIVQIVTRVAKSPLSCGWQ